jgi:acetyltransferase-like isoleucine patch superfamily enzyme
MTVQEFRKAMAETKYIPAGSELHLAFHAFSQEALKITAEMNGQYHEPDEVRQMMAELTASEVDESFGMFPPFYTDCGKNIKIGKRVFINAGCQFQDQGGIEIGDDVLIGPQTIIATLNHDPNPEKRGGMIPKPVKIGNKVWLGARVTICPGVTIGEGAIVGAGAVVTKDVPPRTVVAGVPARVIKKRVSAH